MNMNFLRKLPIPKDVKEEYPISIELSKVINDNSQEIKDILSGKSNKFLVIAGPCSADDTKAVKEYAEKLAVTQEEVKDKIKIVMRVFTAKPRTKGEGYMGLLHQPNPAGKVDMLDGLLSCRKLFTEIIESTHLAVADEMLYPENHRYFSDLLSYVTVGARSSLDQQHRLVASGLNIPVGIKNSLDGSVDNLVNSIISARNPHTFLYRGWEVESLGNEYSHAILRGYQKDGIDYSNFDLETLNKLYEQLNDNNLNNKAIIVDCNHSNSKKNYLKQEDIALFITTLARSDYEHHDLIKGIMIESYLKDGNCTIDNHEYGKSITDPCLGIERTKNLIKTIYEKL